MKEEVIKALLAAARKARENAYAPYSQYPVGAAICADSGRIFVGCNVENISYPAGLCAERNAISAAVVAGERKFSAIAVVGGLNATPMPCGICRQVIREFRISVVICGKNEDEYEVYEAGALLPHAFGEDALCGERREFP